MEWMMDMAQGVMYEYRGLFYVRFGNTVYVCTLN